MKRTRSVLVGATILVALGASIASGSSSDDAASGDSSSSGEKAVGAANEASDVKIKSCSKDDTFDWAEAQLKVTNSSSKASDYSIEVTFTSKDGKTQLGTGVTFISNLAPGQTKNEKVSNTEEVSGKFTCKVTSVDRSESL
jgi:hypothetical protein